MGAARASDAGALPRTGHAGDSRFTAPRRGSRAYCLDGPWRRSCNGRVSDRLRTFIAAERSMGLLGGGPVEFPITRLPSKDRFQDPAPALVTPRTPSPAPRVDPP